MELSDKIASAIIANLPAAVGAELREVLNNAEENRIKVVLLESNLEAGRAELKARKDELVELRTQVASYGDLVQREVDVTAREQKLKEKILEVQYNMANAQNMNLMEMFRVVFKT